jgi:hypothetical protein
MASISALKLTLDRLLAQDCNLLNDIKFIDCNGEVEMATCPLFKSKCQQLLIGRQCLPFAPTLAEAVGKSASLDKLVFDYGLLFVFAKVQVLQLFD